MNLLYVNDKSLFGYVYYFSLIISYNQHKENEENKDIFLNSGNYISLFI